MLSFALIFLLRLVLSAPIPLRPRDAPLLDLTNAEATVYYDLTNELCGNNDPFVSDWAVSSGINEGIPKCEQWAGTNAKSLQQLGTNQIVAINGDLLDANLDEWCGKEVVIYDSTGKQLQFSEGPLFVWDGCDACRTASIIDLSAKAFTELKGGTCGGNNPTGLHVQVIDTNNWEPIEQDGSGGNPATNGGISGSTSSAAASTSAITTTTTQPPPSSSTSFISSLKSGSTASRKHEEDVVQISTSSGTDFASSTASASTATTTSSASSTSPSISSTGSGGQCMYGDWQCSGTELQVCSYDASAQLDWITIETCDSTCSITASGSVDCE